VFDIGFLELLLIGIMALLVLGPERLPGAIRTASLWLGRLKRSFNQIKQEVEREINIDEIKQQLHNESVLKNIETDIEQVKQTIKNEMDDLDSQLRPDLEKLDTSALERHNSTPK
jgi:sec-independent protein translocase protein TatB